jgi:hypothetical protein
MSLNMLCVKILLTTLFVVQLGQCKSVPPTHDYVLDSSNTNCPAGYFNYYDVCMPNTYLRENYQTSGHCPNCPGRVVAAQNVITSVCRPGYRRVNGVCRRLWRK